MDRLDRLSLGQFQVLQKVDDSFAAADTYRDVLVSRARGTTGSDRTHYSSARLAESTRIVSCLLFRLGRIGAILVLPRPAI